MHRRPPRSTPFPTRRSSDLELRAALRKQPSLALRPAALAPAAGTEPLLGPVTAEAERLGVRPGMRLGEGLATCRSEEHTSELQSQFHLVCRLLLEKKKNDKT